MKIRYLLAGMILAAACVPVSAQEPAAPASDPNTSMAYDIARIAASVQAMNRSLKDFVDKFAKVEGISLNEKQQRLVTGMQLLVQAEQRLATQQKFQVELVEKEASLRSRLSQVEIDLNPQQLDRSVAFEGSSQTPEIKDNRRRALQAERASLQAVLQQLQSNLQEASRSVREAQSLVERLRRSFLPLVERELIEQ